MQLLERGIYMPHALTEDGRYFLVVIDSRHRVIRRVPVADLSDVPATRLELLVLLNELDPVATQAA